VGINHEVLQELMEIDGKVEKVSQVMNEIAGASIKQERGVGQINSAVDQMNQLTQHVAATAEEWSAAVQELSGQATQMNSMVASFNLGSGSLNLAGRARPFRANEMFLPHEASDRAALSAFKGI
jgi:hypothetical protein